MISLYTLRKAGSGGGGGTWGGGGIWSGGVGYRIDTCDAYGDTFKEGGAACSPIRKMRDFLAHPRAEAPRHR